MARDVFGDSSSGALVPALRSTSWYGPPVVGSSAIALVQNQVYTHPLLLAREAILDRIGVWCSTAAASSVVRFGIYADSDGVPGQLILDAGTADTSTTGAKESTISQAVNGIVWLAVVAQGGAPSIHGVNNTPWTYIGASSLQAAVNGWHGFWCKTGISGALSDLSSPFNSAQGPKIAVRVA